MVFLGVACWRFYRIGDVYVESGGFMRKRRRVRISDVSEIRKDSIVVYHGGCSGNTSDVYVLGDGLDRVVVEVNEESDALVEEIRKRGGEKADGGGLDILG